MRTIQELKEIATQKATEREEIRAQYETEISELTERIKSNEANKKAAAAEGNEEQYAKLEQELSYCIERKKQLMHKPFGIVPEEYNAMISEAEEISRANDVAKLREIREKLSECVSLFTAIHESDLEIQNLAGILNRAVAYTIADGLVPGNIKTNYNTSLNASKETAEILRKVDRNIESWNI